MANNTGDSIRLAPCGFIRAVFRYLPMFLAVLALVLLLPASAQTYSYLSQWGSAGAGNGQFNTPYGIAVDSAGNVFVADSGNASIQKFNATGTFTLRFGNGGAAANRLGTASGVALDNTNSIIYVADTSKDRIQRYSMTTGNATGASPRWGTTGAGNGQFSGPVGVALDSSINVYVADTGNNRIQKFDSVGTYTTQWGTGGTGNGQFSGPTGIAVDSANNIYVVDTGNNRVQKFTAAGVYVTQWGSSGTGNGQFSSPRHIAIDSLNNVYVADRGNSRVQRFTSTGTYTTQFGVSGTGNGQFTTPQGVALSSGGIAYVADTGNNRIQRLGVLPTAPSVPGATGVTSNAITFTWQDNSTDETGFKVYADAGSAAPTTLRTTTAANITSWNWTALSINTQYAFQVAATNAVGDSAKTTNFTAWTLAATPAAPTLSGTTATSVDVAITADTNPATTTYAIRNTTVGQYVQANGSLGATAVYQTAAVWGTKTVTGLTPDTVQNFVSIAQNGAGVATANSSTSLVRTLAAVPLAPTVSGATTSTVAVAITAGDGNPTSVVYSIQVTTTGQYVQANGSLGATAVYQSAATWGTKTITGLSVNTAYNIVAFARNTAGTVSASSPAATGTTLANTPVAPLVGTITATTINVAIGSGDGNPAATTYAIQDSSSGLYVQAGGTLGASAVYQTSATWATKTVTGLSVDTLYTFVTFARNLAGVSTASSPSTAANTLAATPLAPTVSGATTTTLNVAITAGDGNPFPTTYSIQVNPGGLYVQPSGALGATAVFRNSNSWGTKTVTGLSIDTAYTFIVVAKNNAGTLSAASPAGTGRTLAATPVAPVVSGPTTTSLNVAIGAGDGNPATTTYAIQNTPGGLYVQADGTLGAGAIYQTAATWGTKTVTGLLPNRVYTFVVIARNGAAVSTAAGPSASGTTLAATPLAPVVNGATSTTLNVAIASGDGNAATTTYAIQNTPGGLYVQAGGALGATAVFQTAAVWATTTVTGLTVDTVYNFVVIGKNGAGTLTAAGPSASGRTLAATALAPVVSSATLNTLSVAIASGDGNSGTVTYAIQNIPGGLFVQAGGTLGATAVFQTAAVWGTQLVSGLTVDTVYGFVAIARNGAGANSPAGPSGTGNTLAAVPLAPIVGNPTSTQLDVSIASGDGNPSTTQYAIAETNSGLFVQLNGTLSASAVFQTAAVWDTWTVAGLSSLTSYTFAVTAMNGAGILTVAGPGTVGTTLDGTLPNALAPIPTSTGPTNATSMDFAVDFDEAVQNFDDVSDLVITHSGTASSGVTITGGPVNYTVTLSGITGDGSLTLAVNRFSDVLDLAGNNLASAPTSASVVFDHTPPTLSIGAPTPDTTAAGPVDFTVTYSGATSTSLDASDITLNATATALGVVSVTGSGNTYTVTISSITGDGDITISIAPGTALDDAGNGAPAAGPSAVLTVDSAPQLSLNMGVPVAIVLGLLGAFALRRRTAR